MACIRVTCQAGVRVITAFAHSYQGAYAEVVGWARHYLTLMRERIEAEMDLEAYGCEAASRGDVQFINAEGWGIHFFWKDRSTLKATVGDSDH